MSAYAEHRARRMWAAQDYEGWELPPYPFANDGVIPHNIGRVLLFPEITAGGFGFEAGLWPVEDGGFNMLKAHFKAKEKRQNREKFDR
jgi:hypothetical protein